MKKTPGPSQFSGVGNIAHSSLRVGCSAPIAAFARLKDVCKRLSFYCSSGELAVSHSHAGAHLPPRLYRSLGNEAFSYGFPHRCGSGSLGDYRTPSRHSIATCFTLFVQSLSLRPQAYSLLFLTIAVHLIAAPALARYRAPRHWSTTPSHSQSYAQCR